MKILSEKLFFLSYGIYIFFSILSTTFYFQYFSDFYSWIVVFCIIILIFSESLKYRVRNKEILGMAISLILFLLMFKVTSVAAAIIIYIYCARNIDFKVIAKFTLKFSAVLLVFIIISSYFGIIPNFSKIQSDGRKRQYLGFLYALYPGTLIFNITALYSYIKHKEIKLKNLLFLMGANYWIYLKTASRTNFYLSIIIILFIIIYKYKEKILRNRAFQYAQVLSFLISAVISISITILYSPKVEWMSLLNKFLGNRLLFGQTSVNKYGIRLLGQEIEWIGSGLNTFGETSTEAYSWVDCLYVQMLQHYGLIFMILFMLVTFLAMRQLYKQGEIILLFVISLIAYRSMIDDLSLFLYHNTFWIPLGTVLMHKFSSRGRVKSKGMELKKYCL